MINDVARAKLRTLKRGDTLPYRRFVTVRCSKCNFGIPRSRYRKRCVRPNCNGTLPPKPPLLCRLCQVPLSGRRTSWCSDECFDAYYSVVSSSHLRMLVYRRDKGICAACGLDCEELERTVNNMNHEGSKAAKKVLRENGFNVYSGGYGIYSLWDADHIEPLDEGGSSWEMLNVQTLCHPCHKAKTAEQASRRGKQRQLLGRKWKPTREMLRLVEAL